MALIVLFLTSCLYSLVFSRQYQIVKLSIPWPPGIEIDKIADSEGRVYRVGRLQHNSISLPPQWQVINVVDRVFTAVECAAIIEKAELHASKFGWSKGRHIDYSVRPTSDLPIDAIYNSSDNAQELSALYTRFSEKLWPVMSEHFGLESTKIRLTDLFITKYNASTNERSLGPHKDKSPWSFVISLNDGFAGGGTNFHVDGTTRQGTVGSAVVFNGNQLHGANVITAGVRYIMAGFCEYGEDFPMGSPEYHAAFLSSYNAAHDGYAAQAGFRSGDQIAAVEACEPDAVGDAGDSEVMAKLDGVSIQAMWSGMRAAGSSVKRHRVDITGFTTDEEWQTSAQSCEIYEPGGNTVLWVRRKL